MEATGSCRYRSHELNNLISQLNNQAEMEKNSKIKMIQEDRKVHRSCAQISKSDLQNRQPFNNKTKQGIFFTSIPPLVPYLFIPKYKNQTFIMPDRVLQKGNAAKRFYIKMKDSSICSFKDPQNVKMAQYLQVRQKQKTISGRKMQELNRIIDQNDGIERAKKMTRYLRTKKTFNPTRTTSDLFSIDSPMLQPKDQRFVEMKKTALAKTFGPNMWRPASRAQSLCRTVNFKMSKASDKFGIASQR